MDYILVQKAMYREIKPRLGQSGAGERNMQPRDREDTKGNLSAFKADFEVTLRGEVNDPEEGFMFNLEETHAYSEYKDYLTVREMETIFRRIVGHKSLA